ncbi:MAG: FtsX-like permease family protein [Aeromonas sp.]
MILVEIIIKKILKNKFTNTLNIIELIVAFLAIIILSGIFFNLKFKIDSVKEVVSVNNIKGIVNASDNDEFNNAKESIFVNVPNYLNIIFDDMKESSDYKIAQYQISNIKDLSLIKVNNNFFDTVDFKLSKGSLLDTNKILDQNSTKEVEVLITKDLEDRYPLGSLIDMTVDRKNRKLKVVGILDINTKFWMSDNALVDNMNNSIIMQSNYFTDSFNYICVPNKEKSNEFINSQLKEKVLAFNSSKYKVNIQTNTINELIMEKLNNEILKLVFLSLFTGVLIILVVLGIKSIFEIEILNSRVDFGIHYSLGATTKNITVIIIGEILFDLILAMIVSFIILSIGRKFIESENSIRITFETYVYSIIICLIIVSNPIISAIFKIRKLSPIELIRSKIE